MSTSATNDKDNDFKENRSVITIDNSSLSIAESTKSEAPAKNESIFVGRDLGEMVAPINVAPDGNWGWVAVAASFWNLMVIDGSSYSFGAMKDYFTSDFDLNVATVALLNSLVIGLTYCLGPIAAAFINRFGFRSVCMSGSLVCSLCVLISSFALNYTMLLFFYGIILGIGYSLTNMCSILIIGFYFEKKRPLAAVLAHCGTSVGITIAFPMYSFLNRIGWHPALLLQSSMMGTMFFSSMAFKPVLSITVQLPAKVGRTAREISAYREQEKKLLLGTSKIKKPLLVNTEYKHAKKILEQENANPESLELLLEKTKKPKIKSSVELAIISKDYTGLEDVLDLGDKAPKNLQITIHNERETTCKILCCGPNCLWKPHVKESRPLYRDDAFYSGNVQKLDQHRKSVEIPDNMKTALEYNLAVSRVTTHKDLTEDRTFRSVAIVRVLATMFDSKILKTTSFYLLLISIFCYYLGLLIPYIYIVDRSKVFLIPEHHYVWFVSVIAIGGLLGRLVTNFITMIPSSYICQLAAILTGASTLASNFLEDWYFQYIYCVLFGFFSAIIVVSRSCMLVELYGIELLTNATGLSIFTIGLSCLIAPPAAGLIMGAFGVYYSFMFSGVSQVAGGLIGLLVPLIRKCEKRPSRRRHRSEIKPISMVMNEMRV